MLNRYRNTDLTRENMPGFIEDRVKEMEKHYGKRFLSAITKAFWMVKQHPIIIYDSNACKGLRRFNLPPGSGDYSRYVESWLQFSRRPGVSQQLSAALAWLPESRASRSLARRSITPDQVRAWAAEPWFRDRVLDILLPDKAQIVRVTDENRSGSHGFTPRHSVGRSPMLSLPAFSQTRQSRGREFVGEVPNQGRWWPRWRGEGDVQLQFQPGPWQSRKLVYHVNYRLKRKSY